VRRPPVPVRTGKKCSIVAIELSTINFTTKNRSVQADKWEFPTHNKPEALKQKLNTFPYFCGSKLLLGDEIHKRNLSILVRANGDDTPV